MSVILCTAGYDHTIRFWEALSGMCSRTIQDAESQINRLCITPDKRFVAAAGRKSVKLYDIKSTNPNPVMTFEGHTNNVTGVAFHCEGKWMVTSSEDCSVKVWDVRTGSVQRNYLHKAPVNDVVIHPNQGELISGDRSGTVRIWDLGESRCTHQLIPEEDVSVASVSVAIDGSLMCAGNNRGNVYLWRMSQDENTTTVTAVAVFQAHKDYLTRVLLSPDVKHLATCSADHTAKIWNLDPDYPPARAALEKQRINGELNANHLELQSDTAAAAAAGAHPSPLPAQNTTVGSFYNNNTDLQSHRNTYRESLNQASHSVAPRWSLQQNFPPTVVDFAHPSLNEQVPSSTFHFPPPPEGVPMNPDTQTLFLEQTLAVHQRWVWDCAFSADSAYLVTVCSDHYARLWELSSGQIIRQYNGHHRGAVCVALNDYSEPR